MAGSFYRVRCADCNTEQIVFDRAAGNVTCHSCGHTIARPSGGKAVIAAEILTAVEAR